ncbi:hypothetical protein Dsin_022131 [Dipteronia sinensis]|uniref:Uncharacterized protein n=1 Tax=Dipteronia sinensis TaxID=43782 RepID=A0AAE0DZM9_9ROSI|nr:hypothetical protein Dsin_022131 [Dipteronia sinensis]
MKQYYIPSARELSRLVGVCNAPVIQHFAETISVSTTIRRFDQEARFQDTNMKLVDEYSRPGFYVAAAMEWLCFRLNKLSLLRSLRPTHAPCLASWSDYDRGINISGIGLHDLRTRLGIIPQDQTMFEGNVRNNLDPLEEYTDEQIWEALDKCQLGDEVRKKESWTLELPKMARIGAWVRGSWSVSCVCYSREIRSWCLM